MIGREKRMQKMKENISNRDKRRGGNYVMEN